MPLRSELISEVVRDLLGPRSGIYEILDESPLSEYIIGVLQPANLTDQIRDLDSDAEIPEEDFENGEEGNNEREYIIPTFSPALDPKSRPSVLGLSFEVEGQPPLRLSVCVTWARYFEIREGDRRTWKRNPRVWIGDSIEISDETTLWLSRNQCPPDAAAGKRAFAPFPSRPGGLAFQGVCAARQPDHPQQGDAFSLGVHLSTLRANTAG